MPKITEFDRHKIVILHQQGHSQREIRNKLDKQELVFKKFEELGELKDRKRTVLSFFFESWLSIWQLRGDAKLTLVQSEEA